MQVQKRKQVKDVFGAVGSEMLDSKLHYYKYSVLQTNTLLFLLLLLLLLLQDVLVLTKLGDAWSECLIMSQAQADEILATI